MDLTSTLVGMVKEQGIVSVMFAIAVWWLNKGNREQAKATRDAVMALNRERTDRISKLEEHQKECNEDRKQLWRERDEMWQRLFEARR